MQKSRRKNKNKEYINTHSNHDIDQGYNKLPVKKKQVTNSLAINIVLRIYVYTNFWVLWSYFHNQWEFVVMRSACAAQPSNPDWQEATYFMFYKTNANARVLQLCEKFNMALFLDYRNGTCKGKDGLNPQQLFILKRAPQTQVKLKGPVNKPEVQNFFWGGNCALVSRQHDATKILWIHAAIRKFQWIEQSFYCCLSQFRLLGWRPYSPPPRRGKA